MFLTTGTRWRLGSEKEENWAADISASIDPPPPLTFLERIDLALWGCDGISKNDNALSKRAALGRTPTREDINRAIDKMFYGRNRDRDLLKALGID